MERFIVIHGTTPDVSQDEVWEGFHRVATSSVRGAKWLSSFFLPEREEMLCDWEAPDEAAVRESLEASGVLDKAPIKHIYLAIHADPEYFK